VTGSNVRALLRFWWLVLLGVIAGTMVATVMVYRVELGWPPELPPKLTERTAMTYLASTELLVDSPTGPYLRAGVGITQPVQAVPGRAKTGQSQSTPSQTESTVITDRKALIEAANLFPLLIESDEVSAIRVRTMGSVPGHVRAKALYSIQGENRFRPSVLPVIQIVAEAFSPTAAIRLTRGTAKAFKVWLAAEQRQAKVPPKQRVVVRQLRLPRLAFATGGPSYGLPLLAAAAVMFGFAGLALLLDRSFPRRPAALERIAALVEITDTTREPKVERASGSAQ
jgi:hypothetical protein